jgi:lysophospholipase L1-like esterase
MLTALQGAGATVLTFTLPDLASVVPLARFFRTRLAAYNEAIRAIGARTGAIVVDIGDEPVARDPRLWSVDRLHASTLGHERIAAALCHAIGSTRIARGPTRSRPPRGARRTRWSPPSWRGRSATSRRG